MLGFQLLCNVEGKHLNNYIPMAQFENVGYFFSIDETSQILCFFFTIVLKNAEQL